MHKKGKRYWRNIFTVGLSDGMPNSERTRVLIVNYGLIIVLMIPMLILLYQGLTTGDWYTPSLYVFSLISLTIWFFNYLGYSILVRYIVNFSYPLVMLRLIQLYGEGLHVEYAFFMLFVTSVVLHTKRWIQVGFITYNLIIYFISTSYNQADNPLADQIEPSDPISVFLAIAFCLVLVIGIYFFENLKFEKQTGLLLTELEQKNTHLTNAYDEIERFAYITSHDLKSPVRTINIYITLLNEYIQKGQYDSVSKYIGHIKDGAQKMNNLIDGILEFSKIQALDEHSLESVDLESLLNSIVEETKSKVDRKIELLSDDLPTLLLPKLHWWLLFQKLIDNGVKYNTNHIVRFEVKHEITDETLVVSVKDNGIGIAPAYHKQVFEMFKRLHTDEQYPGSGIGLAICKKIVEKMGGGITLESEQGKGTCFKISIPLQKNSNNI
jgi:signal transduction histidine kinase